MRAFYPASFEAVVTAGKRLRVQLYLPPATNRGVGTNHNLASTDKSSIASEHKKGSRQMQTATHLSASIDYLTITTKSQLASSRLQQAVVLLIKSHLQGPFVGKPWSALGFVGTQVEGARWGIRDNASIVILSGVMAHRFWRPLSKGVSQCSRVDLACTARLAKRDVGLAAKGYDDAQRQRHRKSALIQNSDGGSTVYVGSRKSRYFGRLYDKGSREGEESGWLWRYEVEVKKPASMRVLKRLRESPKVRDFIVSFVWDWFNSRGVTPVFKTTGTYSAIEIEATATSNERSLKWLSTQVKPTIDRLLSEGLQLDTEVALGYQLNLLSSSNDRR